MRTRHFKEIDSCPMYSLDLSLKGLSLHQSCHGHLKYLQRMDIQYYFKSQINSLITIKQIPNSKTIYILSLLDRKAFTLVTEGNKIFEN